MFGGLLYELLQTMAKRHGKNSPTLHFLKAKQSLGRFVSEEYDPILSKEEQRCFKSATDATQGFERSFCLVLEQPHSPIMNL